MKDDLEALIAIRRKTSRRHRLRLIAIGIALLAVWAVIRYYWPGFALSGL